MNNDIAIIRKMCQNFTINPKLIIIPSMSMKTQILKSLNDEGIYPMNLEITTVSEIALRAIGPMIIRKNLILLNDNDIVEMVRLAFEKQHKAGKLGYFDTIEATTGLYRAVAGTLQEMKNAGWKQGMIDLQLVRNEDKRSDIKLLMSVYNELLAQSGFIDMSDVVNIACEPAKSSILYDYIHIIEGSRLTYSEEQLLKNIGWSTSEIDDTFLLDYKVAVNCVKEVTLKRTYGIHTEVKEVIRTILQEKLPFDQVLIVGMSNTPYSQVLYKLISQYSMSNEAIESDKQMPITFSSGLPATITTPVKLLLALLEWIDSGYAVHGLVRLLSDGVMKLNSMILDDQGEVILSRSKLISTLKASGITWQRTIYLPILNTLAIGSDGKKRAAQALSKYLKNEIFEVIPEVGEDGYVGVEEFLKGLKTFISGNTIIKSEIDSQGLNRIFDELNTVIKDIKIPLSELITVIRDQITSMNVAEESPKEGKMHFTTIRCAEWIQRKYVFLMGNDANTFLKTGNEDPVLLDNERSTTLKKTTERYAEDIKSVSRFFRGVKVPVIASYSYYDTTSNRDIFPSLIFQAMQEIAGGKERVKTVNMVLDTFENAIDEADYITTKSIITGGRVNEQICEENLNAEGTKNEETENEGTKNEETENEEIENEETKNEETENEEIENEEQPYDESADPRKNGMVLSSSMLQTYMECGYKYFLKYILNVKELSSIELDRLGWLSHSEIGKLYHSVFEIFMKEVQTDFAILASKEVAIKVIENIANGFIQDFESRLPVASEYHTKKEKLVILRNCSRFAENEVEQKDSRVPLEFEYVFGHNEKMELSLPHKSTVRIRGVVDRMDRLIKDNSIRITDYKTGSTFGYDILEDTGADLINTKSIQPIMYYMALKSLGYHDIKTAEYAFVTSKGDYDSYEVSFEKVSDSMIYSGFTELLDEMSTGKYDFTDNSSNCRYCGYAEICNRQEVVDE